MTRSLVSLALAGLTGWGLWQIMKPQENLVAGKSGKSWRVVLLGKTGDVKTYELFSPAGSFGPHGELSVLRYSQTGSDMGSRKIVGVGQGVPTEMMTAASSDFGLPFNAGGVLAPGTSSS